MSTRQYIGARYVPKFVGTYDNTQAYDALDVVDNGSGTTYIARIQTPPNTPLTDTTHWLVYGSSSGAILDLQSRMNAAEGDITVIKSSILSIGGQVDTNTADIANMKPRLTAAEAKLAKNVSVRTIAVDHDMTAAQLNALATSACWIILAANVSVSNGDTFPNIVGVINAGGMFTNAGSATITFINGCIFLNGKQQIFSSGITVNASGSGLLRGDSRPEWWGYTPDNVTGYGSDFNVVTISAFNRLIFSRGVWHCYPNNTVSHRILEFEAGCIIDGVVHIAQSNATDVTVVGTLTVTVRAGITGSASHISIPNGIVILGPNSAYYNQTSEGGGKGVHITDGASYIDISDIRSMHVCAQGTTSYALSIDNSSHHIHIGQYLSRYNNGNTGGNGIDIRITSATHVVIDDITIQDVQTAITAGISINDSSNIQMGDVRLVATNIVTAGILISGSSNDIQFIGTIRVYKAAITTNFFAFYCNGANVHEIGVAYLIANGADQGLRIVSSTRISLLNFFPQNVNTPIVSTGSYNVVKNWSA